MPILMEMKCNSSSAPDLQTTLKFPCYHQSINNSLNTFLLKTLSEEQKIFQLVSTTFNNLIQIFQFYNQQYHLLITTMTKILS